MRSLCLPPPSSDLLQHAAAVSVEYTLHRILWAAPSPQTALVWILPIHWKHRIFTPRIILKRNKHRHWSRVYENSNAVIDTHMRTPVCVFSITGRCLRSSVRWRRWKFYIRLSEIVFWRRRKILHHLRHRKWRPACKEFLMNILSVS